MRLYRWLPSVLGAIASGLFLVMHMSQRWIVAGEPTSLLVPSLICAVLFLACSADAGIMLFRREPDDAGEHARASGELPPNYRRLAWYFGSLAAFAFLIEPLGFVAVVVIVMPLLLTFGERVPLFRALIITLATGVVVYGVFVRLLAVDLPTGWIWPTLF